MIVDADCHVIECEQTWEQADPDEARVAPFALTATDGKRYLSIDGRLRPATAGQGDDRGVKVRLSGLAQISQANRTMQDIPARLRHMDELGVDIQVLYPTIYLGQLTAKREVEAAMSRSYNRWLAGIWEQADGRLRWAMVPPLLDIEESIEQLRWSRDSGACGIFMRGFEGDRLLHDPYFFPLYEEAEKLDVPVCVHAGCANPPFRTLVASEPFAGAKLPVISACHSVLFHDLPGQFPTLRWAFLEASSDWIPWVVNDIRRRREREGMAPLSENPLRDNRMYVTCQTNDDVPLAISYGGEDSLITGTDYGHAGTTGDLRALKDLEQNSELPPNVVRKILEDNPRRLYGI
jgi:predicted TIM-barrel fold metal-dependent hydrolase